MLSGSFHNGAWVSLPVSVAAGGTVTITVDRTAGANAVLSGVFLGDAGPPPSPTVTSAPEGSWVNSVGSAGYDLAGWDGSVGDLSYLPGASSVVEQGTRYQWAANTTDTRALQSPDGLGRAAGAYYDPQPDPAQAELLGRLHRQPAPLRSRLGLDRPPRDDLSGWPDRGAVRLVPQRRLGFAARSASPPAATVTITVDRTAGPNAVLSGIFLGDAGSPPAIAAPSSPQGSWVGAHGSSGYDLAAWNGASDLSSIDRRVREPGEGQPLRVGRRRLKMSAPCKPRPALEREAATYYDPNQIQLQLQFAPHSTAT